MLNIAVENEERSKVFVILKTYPSFFNYFSTLYDIEKRSSKFSHK